MTNGYVVVKIPFNGHVPTFGMTDLPADCIERFEEIISCNKVPILKVDASFPSLGGVTIKTVSTGAVATFPADLGDVTGFRTDLTFIIESGNRFKFVITKDITGDYRWGLNAISG